MIVMSAHFVTADSGLKISVDTVHEKSDDVITIKLSIEENPGISYLSIPILYDETAIDMISIEGKGLDGWIIGKTAVWASTSDSTYTGEILIYTFKLKEDYTEDTSLIGFGSPEAWNSFEKPVLVEVATKN